jgi:hypothetical protein
MNAWTTIQHSRYLWLIIPGTIEPLLVEPRRIGRLWSTALILIDGIDTDRRHQSDRRNIRSTKQLSDDDTSDSRTQQIPSQVSRTQRTTDGGELGNTGHIEEYWKVTGHIYIARGTLVLRHGETVELPNSHEGDVGATGVVLVVGVNEA